MIDIKFRAWDEKGKSIVKVNCIDFDSLKVELQDEKFRIYDEFICEDVILMQYTGIKDINGVEIYEGDIVDCTRECDEFWVERVVIEDIRKIPKEMYGSNLIKREVIGNIYENKELLEVEK